MKILAALILFCTLPAFAQAETEQEVCGRVVVVGIRQENAGAIVKLITANGERTTLNIPSSRYLYSTIVSLATQSMSSRLNFCAIVQGNAVISAQIGH